MDSIEQIKLHDFRNAEMLKEKSPGHEISLEKTRESERFVVNPYAFTSREWDSETGDYYYRARYYDSWTGRFLSPDPIIFLGGDANLYTYVKNNPVLNKDPEGLWVARGIVTGVVIGVGAIVRSCNQKNKKEEEHKREQDDLKNRAKEDCERGKKAKEDFCSQYDNKVQGFCMQPAINCE